MQRQHNPKIWPMNPDSGFLGEWLGTRLDLSCESWAGHETTKSANGSFDWCWCFCFHNGYEAKKVAHEANNGKCTADRSRLNWAVIVANTQQIGADQIAQQIGANVGCA